MSEKLRRMIVIIVAVVCIAAVLLLIAFNCGLMTPRWSYYFRPEPRLERDLGEQKVTADRAPLTMSHGYESLGDSLREAYDVLDGEITRDDPETFTVDCSPEDFKRVYMAYTADHPEVFWLDPDSAYAYWDYGDSCDILLTYAFEGDDLAEMRAKLTARADGILAAAPASASDYELELYLNDFLIQSLTYDKEAPMLRTAYGALTYGRAVCAGYSKAFQYLCNRAGIACVSIYGNITRADAESELADNSFHEWNSALIEGDWYYVDVTWNDSTNAGFTHTYFNITADELERTHRLEPCYGEDAESLSGAYNVFVPDCGSTAFNYYNKTGVVITDLDDDNDIIAYLIASAKSGASSADFRVDEELDFEETRRQISDSYGYRWLDAANYYNGDHPALKTTTTFLAYTRPRILTMNLEYQ